MVFKREYATHFSLGSYCLSFPLLQRLLGAHSYLPFPSPGSTNPLWNQRWGHDLSSLQVILDNATGTAGVRIPEDWTHAGSSACKEQLCPEPHLMGQGRGTHCVLWPEVTAETSGHTISPVWGCSCGKWVWWLCYCLNKQNHSWSKHSTYVFIFLQD